MFVAASVKEQCLLPASVASVGLSAHTSVQPAPLRQQKAASAIHLSKAFFRVILWQRYKQGESGMASALHGGPPHTHTHTKRCRTGDKGCHGRRCLYIVRAGWKVVLVGGASGPPTPPPTVKLNRRAENIQQHEHHTAQSWSSSAVNHIKPVAQRPDLPARDPLKVQFTWDSHTWSYHMTRRSCSEPHYRGISDFSTHPGQWYKAERNSKSSHFKNWNQRRFCAA